MIRVEVVSFVDHIDLVGTARFGVAMRAEAVAAEYNTIPERTFDDLGHFEFLALKVDGVLLGFRTHILNPNVYAVVSVIPRDHADSVRLIGEVVGIREDEVDLFDHDW